MQTRHAILMLLVLCAAGAGAFALLGSRGTLPGTLGDAYGTVAALASSASDVFSAPRTASESADAGDAGSGARRTTQAAPCRAPSWGPPSFTGSS